MPEHAQPDPHDATHAPWWRRVLATLDRGGAIWSARLDRSLDDFSATLRRVRGPVGDVTNVAWGWVRGATNSMDMATQPRAVASAALRFAASDLQTKGRVVMDMAERWGNEARQAVVEHDLQGVGEKLFDLSTVASPIGGGRIGSAARALGEAPALAVAGSRIAVDAALPAAHAALATRTAARVLPVTKVLMDSSTPTDGGQRDPIAGHQSTVPPANGRIAPTEPRAAAAPRGLKPGDPLSMVYQYLPPGVKVISRWETEAKYPYIKDLCATLDHGTPIPDVRKYLGDEGIFPEKGIVTAIRKRPGR